MPLSRRLGIEGVDISIGQLQPLSHTCSTLTKRLSASFFSGAETAASLLQCLTAACLQGLAPDRQGVGGQVCSCEATIERPVAM